MVLLLDVSTYTLGTKGLPKLFAPFLLTTHCFSNLTFSQLMHPTIRIQANSCPSVLPGLVNHLDAQCMYLKEANRLLFKICTIAKVLAAQFSGIFFSKVVT